MRGGQIANRRVKTTGGYGMCDTIFRGGERRRRSRKTVIVNGHDGDGLNFVIDQMSCIHHFLDECHDRLMQRVCLIRRQGRAVGEFGVQHHIRARLGGGKINTDFDRQHAIDLPAQGLEFGFHQLRVGRFVIAFGVVFESPHHDVFDHFFALWIEF